MTPQTFLVDINKLRAFDAKMWLDIANNYQPVGMSVKHMRIKIDKAWRMYFYTYETRWLNIIAVCQREMLNRKRKAKVAEPLYLEQLDSDSFH